MTGNSIFGQTNTLTIEDRNWKKFRNIFDELSYYHVIKLSYSNAELKFLFYLELIHYRTLGSRNRLNHWVISCNHVKVMNFRIYEFKVSKSKRLPIAIENLSSDVIMERQHFRHWIAMVLLSITATVINIAGLIHC